MCVYRCTHTEQYRSGWARRFSFFARCKHNGWGPVPCLWEEEAHRTRVSMDALFVFLSFVSIRWPLFSSVVGGKFCKTQFSVDSPRFRFLPVVGSVREQSFNSRRYSQNPVQKYINQNKKRINMTKQQQQRGLHTDLV